VGVLILQFLDLLFLEDILVAASLFLGFLDQIRWCLVPESLLALTTLLLLLIIAFFLHDVGVLRRHLNINNFFFFFLFICFYFSKLPKLVWQRPQTVGTTLFRPPRRIPCSSRYSNQQRRC
jgi:hypothetical protein